MTVIETTMAELDEHLKAPIPVLLDLWAPWCRPCAKLAPHLDMLAAQFAGKIKVLTLNMDEDESTFDHFAVRSIPSLIFYAKGEEHGRLTGGTSSLRLRETVKKWLRESGASLPEDNAVQFEAVDEPSEPKKWCAFGGDASVKAAMVARLRQWIEQGEERRPAEILVGDQSFEAAVGMPEVVGDLLDFVVAFRKPGERGARVVDMARVVGIVEDLPVGSNIGPVVASTVHDLMYVSPWAIPRYFDRQGGADLIEKLAILHEKEIAGQAVPEKEWADLVCQSIARIGDDLDVDDSKHIEKLAVPLTRQPLFQVTYMMAAKTMVAQFGEASEVDQARLRAIDIEDDERVLALIGEPPVEADESWWNRYFEQRNRFEQDRRAAEPELWARHDIQEQWLEKAHRDIATYVLDGLLSRLRLVTD